MPIVTHIKMQKWKENKKSVENFLPHLFPTILLNQISFIVWFYSCICVFLHFISHLHSFLFFFYYFIHQKTRCDAKKQRKNRGVGCWISNIISLSWNIHNFFFSSTVRKELRNEEKGTERRREWRDGKKKRIYLIEGVFTMQLRWKAL